MCQFSFHLKYPRNLYFNKGFSYPDPVFVASFNIAIISSNIISFCYTLRWIARYVETSVSNSAIKIKRVRSTLHLTLFSYVSLTSIYTIITLTTCWSSETCLEIFEIYQVITFYLSSFLLPIFAHLYLKYIKMHSPIFYSISHQKV